MIAELTDRMPLSTHSRVIYLVIWGDRSVRKLASPQTL